jgi:hypothetical protein
VADARVREDFLDAPIPSIESSIICDASSRVIAVQTMTPASTRIDKGDAQQKLSLWQPEAVENLCPMVECKGAAQIALPLVLQESRRIRFLLLLCC